MHRKIIPTFLKLAMFSVFAGAMLWLGVASAQDKAADTKSDAKKSAKKAGDKAKKQAKKDPAFEAVVDDPSLPRVLIIGDSISIGYTVNVRQGLKDKANVHRIGENAADTANGVAKIEKWLGKKKWDVIHFNWGLHDIKLGTGEHQVPKEKYEANLRSLVKTMKATGAKLIFATTTPVPEGKLNPPRQPGDVVEYNAIAVRVMKENGVAINDLCASALAHLKEWQRPANVHFNDKGSAGLARHVVAAIELALKK